ncbi:uncharacterized protein LOC111330734 [Stylophora pistillata]|nr:uncharacterized protein LOC111330734 [Stylophora pistillata]XP_022791388.1 uncharacterized protein LOC111330734 [Stylophora pistillata]XP_022791389.1 uncharacterized protein LOC111330734 [Stylophora pistillata]XP_022791390.1 uncharacterized protein LOC111330734 [Stylophora pistillata]XP_022791392.1 uncharacterized protein LOC111330734 [Stylophora pistillata]
MNPEPVMNRNTPGAEAFPPEELDKSNYYSVAEKYLQGAKKVSKKLKHPSPGSYFTTSNERHLKQTEEEAEGPFTFVCFDGVGAVRDVGLVKNCIKKEFRNGMYHHVRDCTTLLKVLLKTKVHAQPSKSGEVRLFCKLYVQLPSRKFHHSLQGPIRNKAVTIALAMDQLYLLQNRMCRKFDYFTTLGQLQVAFKVSPVDALVKLSKENFTQLRCRLQAESCFAEQSNKVNGSLITVKSENENETCTPNLQCISDGQVSKSLLSVGSASSLNLISSSPTCCDANTIPDYPLWRSPSVFGEKSVELTENTFQEGYANVRPLFESSAKLQAEFNGISSKEGLLSREEKIVVVHDGVEQSYQELKRSEQLNCTCPCCLKNSIVVSQLQRSNDIINATNSLVSQLQDEVAVYQDRCHKQEDEINQLKEKLTRMEEEKQGLEAEVGRQLFLESKEKRRKLLNERAQEQSTLDATRGTSYEGELPHGAGYMDRSEQLKTLCHGNGELSERVTFSCAEGNQMREGPQRSDNVADETSDESKEYRESNESTVCNYSSGKAFNSDDGGLTSFNLNADDLPDSSSMTGISNSRLSSCGSVSCLSQSSTNSVNDVLPSTGDLYSCSITTPLNFNQTAKAWESSGDVSGSGKENQERSLSSSMAYEHFERKELKKQCPANGERETEDLDSFNDFWNGDLVDGAVSIPNRIQGSFNLEEVPCENQSPIPYRDTTQKQNLSAARFADQIDTVIDESDCYTSNQSNEWEHSGARPRDRPPKGSRSLEPTLSYSLLVDLVPHQVAGVANTFLARHSEDKHLHESVYYNHAEKMLVEDVSLQGAYSHIEGMTNLANFNRAKLYPGDYQVALRPDPTYCPSYSSGASIRGNGEDGNPFNNTLNGNSVLLPGPSYSYIGANISTNSNFNSFNLGLLASSSVNAQINDNQPSASTDFPTSSLGARANGSDSRLLSELEDGRNTCLPLVSSSRDSVNTHGHRSSNNALNTTGNHLASGTHREGNGNVASSGSFLTSGANTGGNHDQHSDLSEGSAPNRNYGTESMESTDNSLLELEQRVKETCTMVERVLREREEFGREIERKEYEIRAERARKKREREARELEEARGWPQQQEPVTGQSLWLCEHYQRHCRVRFPCCTNFYSCHRCHNNSKECDNEEAKASHATHLKCSYCHHEQEIGEDSAKCRSCGAKMSAYFCGICKHFTSIDKNPYHCDKCGICRIHKDKSFHCDVCNVCLDKRLQGKHKCRPDSGHDECCICLEDAFSGCQILPCSHKVHRECAIAMIQNGIRTCPVCRHPLYSPAPD